MFFPWTLYLIKTRPLTKESLDGRCIAIFIAAYNEERHIEQTIHSIFSSSISTALTKVYIGDDGSTDRTAAIVKRLKTEYPKIELILFSRQGKPGIINAMVQAYTETELKSLLVFMDANIRLDIDCLKHLRDQIQTSSTGMVGASVMAQSELDNVEIFYVSRENDIKFHESRTLGYAVGVFGACYMMRSEYYRPVPSKFITDDLYQTMSVIRQNQNVLYSNLALVYENVALNIDNEFRRKSRYAAGNFQILFHFIDVLNPFKTSIGFVYVYFFHKIMRWISPIVFFGCWVLSFFNLFGLFSYRLMLVGSVVCLFLCFNFLLTRMKINPIGYRIYYFLCMNLAILFGFVNYLKGVKSNVWERSERV